MVVRAYLTIGAVRESMVTTFRLASQGKADKTIVFIMLTITSKSLNSLDNSTYIIYVFIGNYTKVHYNNLTKDSYYYILL